MPCFVMYAPMKTVTCSAKPAVVAPSMLHLTVKAFSSKLIQPGVNIKIACMHAKAVN